MLHHVSFTAKNPKKVADVLAQLIDGRVSRFGPWAGGYIAWAPDAAGTAIEIYPHGTEMLPGEGDGQARFQRNYFASKHTSTHAAISVERTEEEVFNTARRQGWRVATQNRGGFNVIELWVEDTVMLEILTPAMTQQYLSVIKSPHIAASGDLIDTLSFKAVIGTDPATLFKAWTSAKDLQNWWPIPDARIDLRVGGLFELLFLAEDQAGSRGSEGCRILSYVPSKMLSFTWNSPNHLGLRDAQTWVVMEFCEVEGGTELTLTHCGFLEGQDWDQCRVYFQQAWRRVLRRLVAQWNQEVDLRTPRPSVPTQAEAPAPPKVAIQAYPPAPPAAAARPSATSFATPAV